MGPLRQAHHRGKWFVSWSLHHAMRVVHTHATQGPDCEVDGELSGARRIPRNGLVFEHGVKLTWIGGCSELLRVDTTSSERYKLLLRENEGISGFGESTVSCELG